MDYFRFRSKLKPNRGKASQKSNSNESITQEQDPTKANNKQGLIL